jgi:hypothetical protein
VRLFAQANAHKSWANTSDRAARTAAARSAFDQRFYDQLDPGIPDAEREARAQSLRKAYFAEMAARSARARARRSRAAT